jgi:hypothetical protein
MINITDYEKLRDLAVAVKTSPDNDQCWDSFMSECDRIQKLVSDYYCTASDDNLDRAELMSNAWDHIHSNATDLGGYSDPKDWFNSVMLSDQWVTLGIWITQHYAQQLSLSEILG